MSYAVEEDTTAILNNCQDGYAAEFVAKLKPGQNRTHEMLYEILEIMSRIEKSLLSFLSDLNPQSEVFADTDKTGNICLLLPIRL